MEYKIVEAILADLHGVDSQDFGAFRSRLRVLRDKGVPATAKPGKGSRVTFTIGNVWEVHFALTLESFGLPPLRVTGIIRAASRLLPSGMLDEVRLRQSKEGLDIWLQIVSYYSVPNDPQGSEAMVILLEPLRRLMAGLEKTASSGPAHMSGLINISQHVRDLELAMKKYAK